jgi:hypothetical protein
MNRRDLLSECAQPGTPIDVLKNEWCARCGNPECVRSMVGTKKFDRRVLNWEEKLFLHPPLLSQDDPRFAQIVAQKFITIDPGRTPEIRSDWVDPRELKEPSSPIIQVPTAPSTPDPAPAPPTVQAPAPNPPKPSVSPRSASAAQALAVTNAPDQTGKILRGAPEASTTRPDPWAVPDPPHPDDEVVQPGAKIKMGRSGV